MFNPFLDVRTYKTFSITLAIFIKTLSFLRRKEVTKNYPTDQYLQYSSHHKTSCKESDVSSLPNRAYSIINNKNDLIKKKR